MAGLGVESLTTSFCSFFLHFGHNSFVLFPQRGEGKGSPFQRKLITLQQRTSILQKICCALIMGTALSCGEITSDLKSACSFQKLNACVVLAFRVDGQRFVSIGNSICHPLVSLAGIVLLRSD